MDFEFEEGSGLLGPDAEMPPPENPFGTPSRRRRRQGQRGSKGIDPHLLSFSQCPVKLTQCLICEANCYKKSRFCKEHKKDAEACRRDAEAQGQLDFYNRQAESADLYRRMVIEFSEKCRSRGSGARRDRFDWISYQEKTFKQKLLSKGQILIASFIIFICWF